QCKDHVNSQCNRGITVCSCPAPIPGEDFLAPHRKQDTHRSVDTGDQIGENAVQNGERDKPDYSRPPESLYQRDPGSAVTGKCTGMTASIGNGSGPAGENIEETDNAYRGEKRNRNTAACILRFLAQRSSRLEA